MPVYEPPTGPPGAICLVANDFDGIVRNGGIGTYFYHNAVLLAAAGWRVHVLYTSPVEDEAALAAAPGKLKALGIAFHTLNDFDDPDPIDDHTIRAPWFLERSDRVRHMLRRLHVAHRFDLIEFAEWQGLGFRTIQAKRSGREFTDVDLIVRAHSCSQWVREGNLQWLDWVEDARLDYCERYAFDHADIQLSPSAYMLDYLRGIGWSVRPDARVSSYPFPERLNRELFTGSSTRPELVFFGRLEVRKGLEIFLDALDGIDPAVPVTFLGKDTILADGEQASALIRKRTAGRTVKLLSKLNREEALAYVTSGGKVAVIPSLADNLPYTVIEALVHRVPFLASAVGGIPELVSSPTLREKLLFAPTGKALRACLNDYLKLSPEARQALHTAASDAHDVTANRAAVVADYARMASDLRAKRAGTAEWIPATQPLVSVVVPYYNLPQYLPATLASLAAQTYPNLDVIVVNDGSSDPEAVRVFEAMARKYPAFRFLTQVNSGIGAARNKGITEARGEFFIPVDADNIAHPKMVESFVAALQHRPDVAALSCYFKAFKEDADIPAGRFEYFYRPTGGPHFIGAVDNVYGDANGIYRVSALHAVGGYEIDRDTSWEDWELYAKLVNAGHKTDVLPEYLFYYRHREESWMRVTSEWKNHRRVLRQFYRDVRLDSFEQAGLWNFMVSMSRRSRRAGVDEAQRATMNAELQHLRKTCNQLRFELEAARGSTGYRFAHRLNDLLRRFPGTRTAVKAPLWLIRTGKRAVMEVLRAPRAMTTLPPRRAAVEFSHSK